MAYISKESVLQSYKELSHLTDDPSAQGATQITSFLRYIFALARFYSVFQRPCNTQQKEDRDNFISFVGEVVAINQEYYTANFFRALKDNPDFAVGSNFFSVNVVKNSLENIEKVYDFPKRGNYPLFTVINGQLILKEDYYPNICVFLKTERLRTAFAVWLIRNDDIELKDDLYSSIKAHLSSKYSSQIVDCFFPTKEDFEHANISTEVNRITIETSDIKKLFESKKSKGDISPIILYGPPGTGKTYTLQNDYMLGFDEENVWFTTFHQSFSYEEFVEGLKPLLGENEDVIYDIEKGVFYRACEKAALLAGYNNLDECIADSRENRNIQFADAVSENKLVLLCIDEINRGNVAAIFGDLISLIEPSKRLGDKDELILTLPYSKQKFGVPANLLIVGTMNTADRSIQLLDSALRRRFQFKELLPDYDVIKNEKARKILKAINSRVRALINKDSQIGHSYFIDIPQQTNEESTLILKALTSKIIPLLEEYFYNDHSKIRFVLSEGKDSQYPFYIKDEAPTADFEKYADIANFDETMDFYELNPKIQDGLQDENIAKAFIERWD